MNHWSKTMKTFLLIAVLVLAAAAAACGGGDDEPADDSVNGRVTIPINPCKQNPRPLWCR